MGCCCCFERATGRCRVERTAAASTSLRRRRGMRLQRLLEAELCGETGGRGDERYEAHVFNHQCCGRPRSEAKLGSSPWRLEAKPSEPRKEDRSIRSPPPWTARSTPVSARTRRDAAAGASQLRASPKTPDVARGEWMQSSADCCSVMRSATAAEECWLDCYRLAKPLPAKLQTCA